MQSPYGAQHLPCPAVEFGDVVVSPWPSLIRDGFTDHLTATRSIPLNALPSVERRSRALGDIAVTYDRLGRRGDCIRALLAAERSGVLI